MSDVALWLTLIVLGVLGTVLLAEWIHRRRCRVVENLAVGPGRKPRRWTRSVPFVRAVSLAAIVWSLLTLYTADGGQRGSESTDRAADERHRLVFAVDLSPSMQLRDAGPKGEQTRAQRMYDVVDAILGRIDGDVLYTVICFYTDAAPVIVDAEDPALVHNALSGLPIWYAMTPGKTDLGVAVRDSIQLIGDRKRDQVTLFLCTDGDSLPLGPLPEAPPAIRHAYVLGVGDPDHGTFIDDHLSRQDAGVLRLVAGRLSGQYLDVNKQHMPTVALGALAGSGREPESGLRLVDVALYVLILAAAVHALIPVALQYFATDWRVIARPASAAPVAAGPTSAQYPGRVNRPGEVAGT